MRKEDSMIAKPDEVKQIAEKLMDSGYKAYCAGPALTAYYLGRDMSDEWDVYTDCDHEKLTELFPEGEKLGKRIVRMDSAAEDEEEASDETGVITDIITIRGTIDEQLKVYALTIEAIAEDQQNGEVIDPYDGLEALEMRELDGVGDLEKTFEEQAYKMLNAVKYVALYGFKMDSALFKAIQKMGPKLMYVDKAYRLDGFETILGGKYVGKALKLIGDIGMIPVFVGTKARIEKMGVKDFEKLTKNIYMTDSLIMRKALFYLCFERTYAYAAAYLTLDEDERKKLLPVQLLIQNLYFLTEEVELKKFIGEYGWEKYEFIDRLMGVYVKVFERPKDEERLEKRRAAVEKLKSENPPIMIGDMAIDAGDIMRAGITDSRDEANKLMKMIVEDVHRHPERNEKTKLLNYAMKYHRCRLSGVMRKMKIFS